MKHTLLTMAVLFCLACGFSALAQEGEPAPEPVTATEAANEIESVDETQPETERVVVNNGEVIVVCPITGVIDEGILVLVKRAVKEAKELKAKAIIFRVDTPGGRVDSAVEIAKAIIEAPCRSIAYIEGMGAISAGALISFACDDLIMTPSSNIGAAAPVYMTSEGSTPVGEKGVSFMRAKMRSLAESKGHNADIAQAMVDMDIELRGYYNEAGDYVVFASSLSKESPEEGVGIPQLPTIVEEIVRTLSEEKSPEKKPEEAEESKYPEEEIVYPEESTVVLASGKLLTLTPKEALQYGVIETTVESLDAAVVHYMLGGGTYHTIEANWAEKTYRFLTDPTITGLLLMLGIGGLYFEVKTPGFGIPGIIGVMSLCLLFGAHYVLGLTNTIDIVLMVTGFVLILAEIFVIPGFGLAGILGFGCMVTGFYLALTKVAWPTYTWDFDRLDDVVYSLTIASVSLIIFVFTTWKLLPRTSLYSAIVLGDTQEASEGYTVQGEETAAALGLEGVASSMLRPAGRGRFEGKKYNVVTRGDFIAKGAAIKIVAVEGNRYVVEPLSRKSETV